MNGRLRIPAHQVAPFKCGNCGSFDFEAVGLTRLGVDRLDPTNLRITTRPAYRCLGCGGWLEKTPDGVFRVAPKIADPGEEWKA